MRSASEEDLSPQEEHALARAVVRGDRRALERFHSRYSGPLYRFVFYRLGGTGPDVEEVVQETFLAALEGLHRFRGRAALFTWLCGISKNRIARTRRRQSRERLAAALEDVDAQVDAVLRSLDSDELPDEVLGREETQDMVGATMASLPPHYQKVLIDKYVNALPVNEIARRRRSSAKAVESTLTRARIAFRKTFELITNRLDGRARHA